MKKPRNGTMSIFLSTGSEKIQAHARKVVQRESATRISPLFLAIHCMNRNDWDMHSLEQDLCEIQLFRGADGRKNAEESMVEPLDPSAREIFAIIADYRDGELQEITTGQHWIHNREPHLSQRRLTRKMYMNIARYLSL